MVGASSYDAFMILVDAIKKAGTDAKAIQKASLRPRTTMASPENQPFCGG